MKVLYVIRNPGISTRTPNGWRFEVIQPNEDGIYTEEDLGRASDADCLVAALEPITEALLARCSRLKLIQRLGVGYDNIDLAAARKRGIPVCNMPDFNAGTVAEHTIMLVLSLLRRAFESTLLMRGGHWPVNEVAGRGIYDFQNKVLGLLGFGAIGQEVARRAAGFGAQMRYFDRNRCPRLERETGIEPVSLDRLLEESDIVSCHLPITSETEGILSAERLAQMKRGVFFVNTARGALVNEQALAEALQRGAIAGAGIDVFSTEPLPPRHPLRYCQNVILTPHTAGQSREAMERMVAMMVGNLKRVAAGQSPLYRIEDDLESRPS